MPGRLLYRQPIFLAPLIALAVAALAALRYLDQSVAQAGLWFFLMLTLTTGFFHGALDIVLMQREFSSASRLAKVLALYAGSAVLIAVVCAHSGWLMVLVLLVMSVWHFGEPYGRWADGTREPLAWIQRVVAGGAPVMLPVLLSTDALQTALPMAVALDSAWAFNIWRTLAWIWVGIGGFGLVVFRQRLLGKPLLAEITLVFAVNLLLSPLMAFSLYFGILHAMTHIFRVASMHRQGVVVASESVIHCMRNWPAYLAIIVTSLATLLLLSVLTWYVRGLPAAEHRSLLNVVLVALTALTFPHLILVSRNAHWLTVQPVAKKQSRAQPRSKPQH